MCKETSLLECLQLAFPGDWKIATKHTIRKTILEDSFLDWWTWKFDWEWCQSSHSFLCPCTKNTATFCWKICGERCYTHWDRGQKEVGTHKKLGLSHHFNAAAIMTVVQIKHAVRQHTDSEGLICTALIPQEPSWVFRSCRSGMLQ